MTVCRINVSSHRPKSCRADGFDCIRIRDPALLSVYPSSPSVTSICHIFGGIKETFGVLLRKLRENLKLILDKGNPKRYNNDLIRVNKESLHVLATDVVGMYILCSSVHQDG